MPRSPLNQRGKPPRPLLCLPRRRLPRSPEPASGRPGAARGARAPRARHLAARGELGGQRISAPGGGLPIFRAKEATISQMERQPRIFSLATPPPPQHPWAGGHHAGSPPRPGPESSPLTTRGDQSSPHAHRPERRLLALAATPASPSRRSDGRSRGGEARRPCPPGGFWGRGLGRGGGRAASRRAPRLPRAPSLCV